MLLIFLYAKIIFMKKLLLVTSLFCTLFANAQSPQLSVKGNDSALVKMSQLIINIKIVGNIAYSTAEMHFFNSGQKQMEAALLFPLPEGVSVSRYAIDINGKIREAVPVNKNKGKQVFEAIEHRNVDPGLLEKVEGNNFKTRIYPVMPKGERIVIIGYEEVLQFFDKSNLSYQFLSKYPQAIEKFEVKIAVLGNAGTASIVNENNDANILSWTPTNQTSFTKINYQPSEKWTVKIPVQNNVPNVVMQTVNDQYFFYINTDIENNKIQKKIPSSIGIIWDNSLSCKTKDLKKELALLDGYFALIKNTTVTLYLLNYTFSKEEVFVIKNGDWKALRNKLQNTIYDGGTRFSQINYAAHDEYLFFTDGLSSLSSNALPLTKKPVYTISSSISSDYAFLNYYALQSGANFINLNQFDVPNALDKLVNQNLRFLGIKENNLVSEIYPMKGTPVSGGFNAAGISLKANNKIVLLFGYGENAILEKEIVLNATKNVAIGVSIEKLWAQKKIANLEMQYEKNAEEIEILSKRYGIITQNTSLIVLENISDYMAYDIIPPIELRAEYDRMVKAQRQSRLAQQKNIWNNIDNYFNELFAWWKKDIHYIKPKVKPLFSKKKVIENRELETVTAAGSAPTYSANFSAPDNNKSNLEEVVVTALGRQTQDKSVGFSFTTNAGNALQGKVAGLQITTYNSQTTSSIAMRGNSTISNLNNPIILTTKIGTYSDSLMEEIKTTSWNPDRLYLKLLKASAPEKRYSVYLELRETQINNPNFYYDVANFFYDNGEKQRALSILSNIADLSLENHQLYKTLTYTLSQWHAYDDALFTAKQIVKWREHEPQSHRDLALALENTKQYQAAVDELIKGLEINYYEEMDGQYEGVEDIILMDINRIISEHPSIKTGKLDKKYLAKMPVDVRIILSWNQMDVDIDLHVIEPNKEECYYGHKTTDAGARFSKDFTEGYGPEQYLIRNAVKGKYLIKTNYYGETTLTENGPATVFVEIYTTRNGVTNKKIKTVQLGKIKENEVLAEINIE